MKKIKYLGGGWTEDPVKNGPEWGFKVTIGKIYDLVKEDDTYQFIGDCGGLIYMWKEFCEVVEDTPEDKFYRYIVINDDKVVYRTNNHADVESYHEEYGGYIAQVVE